MASTSSAGSPRGTRGRRLVVVGALALAMVVGLATINAGSAGTDPPADGADAPTPSPSLVVAEPTPIDSPETSDESPDEPSVNGKGKGGGKGRGND